MTGNHMYSYEQSLTVLENTIPCQNFYNTSDNHLFSGEESYYFEPEVYNKFISDCEAFKDKHKRNPYISHLNTNNPSIIKIPQCSVYIAPGNWFTWYDYEEPNGWDMYTNRYNTYPGTCDWFITVTLPESQDPTNEYVEEHAVLCPDPWKYRLSLIDKGYIECICNSYYVDGVERVLAHPEARYY